MGESSDFLRTCGEVKMPRIDHSDVYFENERLAEDLVHNLDILHRNQHRQAMARHQEIAELKKSLAVIRHSSSACDSLEDLGQNTSKKKTKRLKKSSSKTVTISSQEGGEEKPETPVSKARTFPMPRRKTISVKMPHPKDDSSEDTDDGYDDEAVDGDSGDDDDDDDDVDNNNNKNIPYSDSQRARTAPNTPMGYAASSRPQNRRVIQRPSYVVPKPKTQLELRLMKLNLDKVPTHWYTSVVPASDVNVNRRGGSARSRAVRNSPMFPRKPAGKDRRPHTSIGIGVAEMGPRRASSVRPSYSRDSRRSGEGHQRWGLPVKPETPPILSSGSVVVCERPPTSNSRRLLFQLSTPESDEEAVTIRPKSGVQRKLVELKKESVELDQKVRAFVHSLEEFKSKGRKKTLLEKLQKPSTFTFNWARSSGPGFGL